MRKIIPSLKQQGVLFGEHYIDDKLRPDDLVYVFDRLLGELDLSSVTQAYSQEGGAMYCPREKLSLLLFAYLNGETSSIQIASLIRRDLRFMYLAGGNTISAEAMRTFRRKHWAAFKEIFLETVYLAEKIGLIKLDKLFALDGSKFRANASPSLSRKKKNWEKKYNELETQVAAFLEAADEQDRLEEESDLEAEEAARRQEIQRKLEELRQARNKTKKTSDNPGEHPPKTESPQQEDESFEKKDSSGENSSAPDKSLEIQDDAEQSLQEPDETQSECNKSVQEQSAALSESTVLSIEEAEKFIYQMEKIQGALEVNADASDELYINLTDPTCRTMKMQQSKLPGYNVQFMTNQQVIVAMEVTQDENDQNQLKPLIEQTIENLNLEERDLENPIPFAADAGYNKGENLDYLNHQEIFDAHVSMHNRKDESEAEPDGTLFEDGFQYNEEKEHWVCPQGEILESGRVRQEGDKTVRHFRGKPTACVLCPLRQKCLTTKQDRKLGYKTLRDDGYRVARQSMRRKLQTEAGKQVYAKRSSEVEPMIGQLKANHVREKIRRTGFDNATSELLLGSLVHNLKKIMRFMEANAKLGQRLALHP